MSFACVYLASTRYHRTTGHRARDVRGVLISIKSVSQLNTGDLRDLLNDGAVEAVLLEFISGPPFQVESLPKPRCNVR
jgi:hypothetical protein